jgi:hypothetical protein
LKATSDECGGIDWYVGSHRDLVDGGGGGKLSKPGNCSFMTGGGERPERLPADLERDRDARMLLGD